MALYMDRAEVDAHYKRLGMKNPLEDDATKTPKPTKYRNVPTVVDGHRFPSKREAGRWQELKLMVRAGEIMAAVKQVPFQLPGGVRYIADFVLLHPDGTFTVEDAKGVLTDEYKIKKKLMRERWGIEIVEV